MAPGAAGLSVATRLLGGSNPSSPPAGGGAEAGGLAGGGSIPAAGGGVTAAGGVSTAGLAAGASMEPLVAVATTVRTRTADPGATVTLMMLASGQHGGIAVDLASGALVRARYLQPLTAAVRPFEVTVSTVADTQDEPDPTRPEALVIAGPLQPAGRMHGRGARRVLRPLVQPAGKHLLGVPGPAVPFWTMTAATRPSVVLVQPEKGPTISLLPGDASPHCRFRWGGQELDLPLQDRRLQKVMARTGQTRLVGPGLAHAIGGSPSYLVVTLTPPCGGHCYKVVAGILPRP